jgi:hypothetical protein
MFEDMLVSQGLDLTKFWFSVSPAEQRTRFAIRLVDPVRNWKFSPMDMESIDKWEQYTEAKQEMFAATDTDYAPWIVVKSNDKKRARINAMRHLLAKFDYDDKDDEVVGEPDPLIVGRALEDSRRARHSSRCARSPTADCRDPRARRADPPRSA